MLPIVHRPVIPNSTQLKSILNCSFNQALNNRKSTGGYQTKYDTTIVNKRLLPIELQFVLCSSLLAYF